MGSTIQHRGGTISIISYGGKIVGKFIVKTGLKKAYRKCKTWYFHNIRNEKTKEEKLKESAERIEELEERNKKKDERLSSKENKLEKKESKIADVKRDLSVKERLMESLEIEGISRQELFRKNLDDPQPFLIFRLGGQDPELDDGRGWVRAKLEDKYGAETVGSSYVIPPKNFPEKLSEGKKTLSEWIEDEIDEEEKKANYVYVIWADLKQGDIYWRKDYESRSPMRDLEDQFEISNLMEEDFYEFDEVKDALELVKKGDIAFFSAKFVDEDEIKAIHREQKSIEEELGDPSLKELAKKVDEQTVEDALRDYVADPGNVTKGIKEQANIWYEELYENSENQ